MDLDRAFGDGENLALVRRIVARVGGAGAASSSAAGCGRWRSVREGLEQGVTRVVIGTAAAIDPAIVPDAVGRRGRGAHRRGHRRARRAGRDPRVDRDVRPHRRGPRAPRGGRGSAHRRLHRRGARRNAAPAPTSTARAGCRRAGVGVIASGGVAGAGDIRAAREAGLAGAIVGRALYEGRLTLAEALEAARAGAAMILRARRRPGARGRPGRVHLPPAGARPAGAAGCRSPAAR